MHNLPFLSIMLAMLSGVLSAALSARWARRLCFASLSGIAAMSVLLLVDRLRAGTHFTYQMGHFPAPWGNELCAGALEALLATVFCVVIILSLIGGMRKLVIDVEESKQRYYYLLVLFLLGALLALLYTNDLFTAYVFIEINTIATCGLIMIRHTGRSIAAAIQYMVMSLLGSGLLLIGITLLYTLTGHLLMFELHAQVVALTEAGQYPVQLHMTVGLLTVGLMMKSGLYPFHIWIPEAYASATPASSALLSGLASKGYIVLLLKLYLRVIGTEYIRESRVLDVVFVFGVIAILLGSLHARREGDIRSMSAYSSVAHIGYIYMCIGFGTQLGMLAAVLHMITHAVTKPLLFLTSLGLSEVSGLRLKSAEVRIRDATQLVDAMKRYRERKQSPVRRGTRAARKKRRQEELLAAQAPTELFESGLEDLKQRPDFQLRKPYADSNRFGDIKGAAYRNPIAGAGFAVGALSIVGVPLFAGFVSKICISQAALALRGRLAVTMLVLAVSTILMVTYFLRMVLQIYTPSDRTRPRTIALTSEKGFAVAVLLFLLINLYIGLFSGGLLEAIAAGLKML